MKRFIFVIVLTILCTTNNAQQIQQRIWLLMETRQELTYVDSTRMMFSNNIADFFSSVGVKEVFPVFPFSKNDTLRRIYEIQILSDNINSLFDRDEIKQIYVQEEPENIQLYMPSDAMWDYYYSDSTSWMWHLQKINANQAWDITKGDTSIKIAIIDTWFDIGHPDLTNQMYCNYDPYDNSCFYSNGNADNHGTTVASFAAAETDGGGFLSSIGFNCKIIPYNVNHGHYLERAHHASLAMNADVLTSSTGGWYCDTNFNEIERMAVREILDNGTVIRVFWVQEE